MLCVLLPARRRRYMALLDVLYGCYRTMTTGLALALPDMRSQSTAVMTDKVMLRPPINQTPVATLRVSETPLTGQEESLRVTATTATASFQCPIMRPTRTLIFQRRGRGRAVLRSSLTRVSLIMTTTSIAGLLLRLRSPRSIRIRLLPTSETRTSTKGRT